jgi:uncharacterized protein (DUF488 family)
MVNPIFTIGHSTRSIEEFVDLLRESSVALVIDVRSIPRSRTNPQFNRDALPGDLARSQIGYEHIAELGGLRGKQSHPAGSSNDYWRVQSFRNYADYALTAPFREGLERLRRYARERRSAIMCAETLWWRCHRRIIADYLLAAGDKVLHILGTAQIEAAHITPGALVREDGAIIYARAGQS